MFDFGVEEDKLYGVFDYPREGERTLLIDSDLIPYIVGFTVDPHLYELAKMEGLQVSPIWGRVKGQAISILNKWMRESEFDSAMLFQSGPDNFRNEIAVSDPYKGDRSKVNKPPFFYELREFIRNLMAEVSDNCEADDDMSKRAWQFAEGFGFDEERIRKEMRWAIATKDKDLRIVPWWHYDINTGEFIWSDPLGELTPKMKPSEVNKYEHQPIFKGEPVRLVNCSRHIESLLTPYNEMDFPDCREVKEHEWYSLIQGKIIKQDTITRGANKGKGKFKRKAVGKQVVETIDRLKGTGLKFFYSQLLTGDSVDCYKGLEGCGPACAFSALNGAKSEQEMFEIVRAMYSKKYRHKADARLLEMGRLAWMQTYEGELWHWKDESNVDSFPKLNLNS